jgi:predicted O-methyltransferase YrrM
MKMANIILNAIRPGYAREMVHKVGLRWQERRARAERAEIEQWCRARSRDIADWAQALDPALWAEARAFHDKQRRTADEKLRDLGVDLGGGGAYDLLYFLTRLLRPQTIVETGVAAGFSSRAFLTALRSNGGGGRLFSSDFPYFRLHAPEQYVGILVEPELRSDWQPLLNGDRRNLPEIIRTAGAIDLVHYDSDKSYQGRAFAARTLEPKLAPESVLIFDDIQDNWHFRDAARDRHFLVFPFEGKWVGLIGGPPSFHQGERGSGT